MAALAAGDHGGGRRQAPRPEVTVMTCNVFLGADLAPAINNADDRAGDRRCGTIWNEMQRGSRTVRGRSRARSSGRRPTSSAQEVALWRKQTPSDLGGPPISPRDVRHPGRAGLPRDPAARAESCGRQVPRRRGPAGSAPSCRWTPTAPTRPVRWAADARLTMRDPGPARQQGEARQDARVTSRRGTSRASAGS